MKNIFIIFVLFFFCSCGTINKLKHKQTTKSDSVEVIKTNTTTAETLTTTERIDTNIAVKQDSATTQSDLSSLQKGDTTKVNTGTIEIDTFFDKKDNKIITKVKTKPAPVHALIDKKTVEVKKEQKQENKKVEVKKENKINDKTIHKEGGGISTGVIITLSILLLLIILYLYLRTKFKFLP